MTEMRYISIRLWSGYGDDETTQVFQDSSLARLRENYEDVTRGKWSKDWGLFSLRSSDVAPEIIFDNLLPVIFISNHASLVNSSLNRARYSFESLQQVTLQAHIESEKGPVLSAYTGFITEFHDKNNCSWIDFSASEFGRTGPAAPRDPARVWKETGLYFKSWEERWSKFRVASKRILPIHLSVEANSFPVFMNFLNVIYIQKELFSISELADLNLEKLTLECTVSLI